MNPQTKLERWEKLSEWPLAGIAVVFLAAYSIQVLAQPQGYTAAVLQAVLLITYLAFVVDYVVRLSLAPNRARWFVRHLFDLAIVALPMLRPLQLLRLVVVVTALQRAVGDAIRGRVILYTVSCATVLIYAASLAILEVERSEPNANIKNFGDAVWWSISTVTIRRSVALHRMGAGDRGAVDDRRHHPGRRGDRDACVVDRPARGRGGQRESGRNGRSD